MIQLQAENYRLRNEKPKAIYRSAVHKKYQRCEFCVGCNYPKKAFLTEENLSLV